MEGHIKGDRIYDRCMYRDCKSHRFNTNSRLYHFPPIKDPRHEQWIQATGNPRLKSFKPSTLRSTGICGLHFGPGYISVTGGLRRDARPIPYSDALNAKIASEKIAQSNQSSHNGTTLPTDTAKPDTEPKQQMETGVEAPAEPKEQTETTKVSDSLSAGTTKIGDSSTGETTKIGESSTGETTKIGDSSTVETTKIGDSSTVETPKTGDSSTVETPKEDDSLPVKVTEPKHKYEKRANLSFFESDNEDMSWTAMEPEPQPQREVSTTSMNDNANAIDSKAEATKDMILKQLERHNQDLHHVNSKLLSRIANYQKLNTQLRRKLRHAQKRNAVLVVKSRKRTVDEFLDENGCVEPAARTMVKLQVHRKHAPFADDEKNLARQIFCYSAPVYKRLIKAGCSFPSVSTIRAWIAESDSQPEPCPVIAEK